MPSSIPDRLSALDASFLAVESPLAPMHVGWVASFDPPEDGPAPTAQELIDHIGGRMEHAHRYRQKLADVPLGVHDPVWVDDPDFDPARHLYAADGDVIDEVLSTPLPRDRPLWEMWLSGDPPMIIGKAHHCMVDGLAVVELGNLLLDADPDGEGPDADEWAPAPAPTPGQRLGRAIADRIGETAGLLASPLRLAANLPALPGTARMLSHTVLPPAPSSPLNRHGSGRRHHHRVTRSLDDIRAIRRAFGVTPNDVLLAACAGALHEFLEEPMALKVMVPADVRAADDAAATGNRISFVFLELPCHEPDPVKRLQAVHRSTSQRRRDEEAERLDDAFRLLALTPKPFQRTLAHAFAHPRLYNLTISSVPGPAVTRYLRGCRLRTVHSAVPLSAHHGLSIGVVTVAGNACFGISTDPDTVPEADALAAHLDAALDELLDLARDA
ncbi:MAG TPA: wax ester/triacylglycerol synthase family O-acyltransferase [Solirubrobacteraceae bacterium]|nr:wax ester/triacylglycerol synthase family O-acyltransferase [Solirubrobacteraceae bacterium]